MMRSCSGLTFMLFAPFVVKWRCLSDVPEEDNAPGREWRLALAGVSTRRRRLLIICNRLSVSTGNCQQKRLARQEGRVGQERPDELEGRSPIGPVGPAHPGYPALLLIRYSPIFRVS